MAVARVPKIRFATAAYAIDATPKSLRNWLSRQQLSLISDEEKQARADRRGWLHLDLIDIAVLAVTRKLVDFGMQVDDANRQGREAILDRLRVHLRKVRPDSEPPTDIYRNVSETDINAALAGVRYVVWSEPDHAFGWHTEIVTDTATLPAPAVIVVAVDQVVGTALQRAREHLAGRARS